MVRVYSENNMINNLRYKFNFYVTYQTIAIDLNLDKKQDLIDWIGAQRIKEINLNTTKSMSKEGRKDYMNKIKEKDLKNQITSFEEALKKLNIEDYRSRILNSNSKGELFFLQDYVTVANILTTEQCKGFREYFDEVVKFAENNWKRPESIFQYIIRVTLGEKY